MGGAAVDVEEDGGAPNPKLGSFVAADAEPKEKDAGEADLEDKKDGAETEAVAEAVVVVGGGAAVAVEKENGAGEADFDDVKEETAAAVAGAAAGEEEEDANEKGAGEADLPPFPVTAVGGTAAETAEDSATNENGDADFAGAAAVEDPKEKEDDVVEASAGGAAAAEVEDRKEAEMAAAGAGTEKADTCGLVIWEEFAESNTAAGVLSFDACSVVLPTNAAAGVGFASSSSSAAAAAAILALFMAVAETKREDAKSPEAILDFTIGTFRLLRAALSLATRSGEMTGRRGVEDAPGGGEATPPDRGEGSRTKCVNVIQSIIATESAA